jgi:hypothetical protein
MEPLKNPLTGVMGLFRDSSDQVFPQGILDAADTADDRRRGFWHRAVGM